MNGILGIQRRWLRTLAEPCGDGGRRDELSLRLWEGYAVLRSAANRLTAAPRLAHATSAAGAAGVAGSAVARDPAFYRRHITETLLPFWARHAVDHRHGGFITHLDRCGRVYDDQLKTAAMQARMVYGFSVGHELEPASRYLELATSGVRFLVERLWDEAHGGWFTSVHRDGRVRDGGKRLFVQAYVMLGLLEYARVTGDPAALEWARRTYDLLERYGWDGDHPGYHERCRRDWTLESERKTICVHLDMLMAVLALHGLTRDPAHAMRARQLADAVVGPFRDRRHGCVVETCRRDWTYSPVPTGDQIQYGHNLKAVWLLVEMSRLTDEPTYAIRAKEILDFCLRFGWDARYGGFYQFGYRNGRLASDEKLWWPEAEGIVALISVYRISGDPVYLRYLDALVAFCVAHFVDSEHGEWRTACHADGTVKDDHKGGSWKAAYHTVQACFYAHAQWMAMRAAPGPDAVRPQVEKA